MLARIIAPSGRNKLRRLVGWDGHPAPSLFSLHQQLARARATGQVQPTEALPPVTGYVHVYIVPGRHVSPPDVLVEMRNRDGFYLELKAAEKDVARGQPGQLI